MVETTRNSMTSGRYSAIAIAISLGVYAVVQTIAYAQIGAFEFPLDDVYIHLAVAEQIAVGGYGVNPGEFTSAASSPLYPLLLTPFAGSSFQVWMPVFWNILAMVLAAGLWGRIVAEAVTDWRWALGLAVIGPLAFNLPGLAFVGMEHTLHVLAGMAVLRGLQTHFKDGKISWLLIAGMLLGPLVRFEGLAVTGGAMVALTLTGRWALGVTLFAAGVLLVAAFSATLVSLGLEPLPNSVMAKLAGGGQDGRFSLSSIPVKIIINLVSDKAVVLLVAAFVALAAWAKAGKDARIARACLVAAVFTGIGHLILGQFGWFNRYELYAISFVFGLMVIAVFQTELLSSVRSILAVGMAYLAISYSGWLLVYGVHGPSGIYSQQRNMSVFVKEVYQKPVAVTTLDMWLGAIPTRCSIFGGLPPTRH